MLSTHCHCGAVRIDIPRRPRSDPKRGLRMGVKARNFHPDQLGPVRIRLPDRAVTEKYLDDAPP